VLHDYINEKLSMFTLNGFRPDMPSAEALSLRDECEKDPGPDDKKTE